MSPVSRTGSFGKHSRYFLFKKYGYRTYQAIFWNCHDTAGNRDAFSGILSKKNEAVETASYFHRNTLRNPLRALWNWCTS